MRKDISTNDKDINDLFLKVVDLVTQARERVATAINIAEVFTKFHIGQYIVCLLYTSYPSYFAYFPARVLNNCVLLPIEAESQNTALRIFSTLNDRGKPLSDADVYKRQGEQHSYEKSDGK